MKIALLQSDLAWENPAKNRAKFQSMIEKLPADVDLVVLPEMFSTGFSMNAEVVSEPMNGPTVSWLKSIAKDRNCALTGSIIITENNKFYNRLVFVLPNGELYSYDKRHLFSLANEAKIYTLGTEKLIINYRGFSICPLICYDLRFPVFSRNTTSYDLLLYVANWPTARLQAWDILLRARAVENLCYVVGVNRTGTDESAQDYTGHSQAIDYLGNYILEPKQESGAFIINIDKEKMLQTRLKLGFLDDLDRFELL